MLIVCDYTGKGRSIDHIIIERFFRTLKYNCIFINDFDNIKELKKGICSTIGYKKAMASIK